jgi:hypothetical protein
MELFCKGELFILYSMPVPVCRPVRAKRCGKARGREYCGYCAAKDEKFFGWRLHLIVTPTCVPVNFTLLPASFHDLTPVHELSYLLPPWCRVLGDKAYNATADEATIWEEVRVRFVPIRKCNREPNIYEERLALRQHRKTIETINSQLNRMGIQLSGKGCQ